MLFIDRKPGQKVIIGDDIEVWPTINSHGYATIKVDTPTGVIVEHVGHTILIGENISVQVMGIQRRQTISLGFNAPSEIPIWREEIYNKIQKDIKDGGHAKNNS